MDPNVFKAHGSANQPYPVYLPDNPLKVTIVMPWNSLDHLYKTNANIDWTQCANIIFIMTPESNVSLAYSPHPQIGIVSLNTNSYDINHLMGILKNDGRIKGELIYYTTTVISPNLWATLRVLSESKLQQLDAATDAVWSRDSFRSRGFPILAAQTTLKNIIRRMIQPMTINVDGAYTEMCQLATAAQTDKSLHNLFTHRHPYTSVYNLLLGSLRTSPQSLTIGEIGVLNGASINMWFNFFGNDKGHQYHAFDIDEVLLKRLSNMPNVHTHLLDSGDKDRLRSIFGQLPAFDLLLEDASHRLEHQVIAVRELTKYLKVGGFLIIEDIFRAIPVARFQEAVDDVIASGIDVEAYMITPEAALRFSPGWENDRMLVIRRLS